MEKSQYPLATLSRHDISIRCPSLKFYSIRPFQHSQYTFGLESGAEGCATTAMDDGGGGGDYALPRLRNQTIAPIGTAGEKAFLSSPTSRNGKSSSSVFGASVALQGFGSADSALPPPPPLPPVGGGGGNSHPVLTNARLARHDEEEAAKRVGEIYNSGGVSGVAGVEAAGSGLAHERSALARRTAAGGWPGIPAQQHRSGTHRLMSSSVAEDSTREKALRGLVAIGELPAAPRLAFVDLTGGGRQRQLSEETDEEALQKAIQLSLQGIGVSGSGGDRGDSPGDETETDEEPGYGAHPSVGEGSLGMVRESSAHNQAPPLPTPNPQGFPPPLPPSINNCGGRDGGSGGNGDDSNLVQQLPGLASGAPTAPVDNQDAAAVRLSAASGKDCHRDRQGSSGSYSGSGSSGDSGDGGDGRERGAAGRGHESDNNCFRRLRRRRDESGASTPGEQSPNGADGALEHQEGHEGYAGVGGDCVEGGAGGAAGRGGGDESTGLLQKSSSHERSRREERCAGASGGSNGGVYSGYTSTPWLNSKRPLPPPPPLTPQASALTPSPAINSNTGVSSRRNGAGNPVWDSRRGGSDFSTSTEGNGDGVLQWDNDCGKSSNNENTGPPNVNSGGDSVPDLPAVTENSENYSGASYATTAGGGGGGGGGTAYTNGWRGTSTVSNNVAASAATGSSGSGSTHSLKYSANNPHHYHYHPNVRSTAGGADAIETGETPHQLHSTYRQPLELTNFTTPRESLSENGIGGLGVADSAALGSGYMTDLENEALIPGGDLGEDTGSAELTNLLAVTEWEHEVCVYVCVCF